MLGRTWFSEPVCNFIIACPCAWPVVCRLRMMQRSSAKLATWGNRLLISTPLSPCFLNSHGEASNLPGAIVTPSAAGVGKALSRSRASSGLGSKVSTCEGPPGMKRKMMRLARGGKCGGRGDSGLFSALAATRAVSASKLVSAK